MSTKQLTRNAPAQVQTPATKSATYEGYVVGSTKIPVQRSKSVIMHKVDQTASEFTRKTVTRFCQCMHLFFSSFIRKTSLLSSQKQTNTWEPLRVRNSPNSFSFNAMISVAVLLGVRIELRIQSRMKMRRHEHGQMACQWLKSFWPPCLLF